MRRTGVIPPGKAGVIVMAAALVPIALKNFRPLVKRFGKGVVRVGKTIQRIADEPKGYERNPTAQESRMDKATQPEEVPQKKEASPTGHNEVDAHNTEQTASTATAGDGDKNPRKTMKGASPPSVNPKRSRKKD